MGEGMNGNGRHQCEHIKADGSRCRAFALPGETLCLFHHPDKAREGRAARSAGGKTRIRKAAVLPGAADVKFATQQDVLDVIGATVSQVRRGELDVRVANCVLYGCSIGTRVIEGTENERRLDKVEEALELIVERNGHGRIKT